MFRHKRQRPYWIIVTGILISASIQLDGQQRCLQRAWVAFERNDYVSAAKFADECIVEFGPRAAKEQTKLESNREPMPPTGSVENPADKKQIYARWAANDVATAYYLKGRSAEYLFQKLKDNKPKEVAKAKQVAIDAYTSAAKLTYGRCYDPATLSFWSPAEVSQERLEALRSK